MLGCRARRLLRTGRRFGSHVSESQRQKEIAEYGIHIPPPDPWKVYLARMMGGTAVFWILYRAKHDGPVVLGLRHPWDH
ncbi:Uncharacterized protein PBTT_04594 [Plasmodiophora brassicae]